MFKSDSESESEEDVAVCQTKAKTKQSSLNDGPTDGDKSKKKSDHDEAGRGNGNEEDEAGGGTGDDEEDEGGAAIRMAELDLGPSPVPDEILPENAIDISPDQQRTLWKIEVDPGNAEWPISIKLGMKAVIKYNASWLMMDEGENLKMAHLWNGGKQRLGFEVGEGEVLRLFDVGVVTMKRIGEKAMFIANFDCFAYGDLLEEHWTCPVTPDGDDSFLLCEVELISAAMEATPDWNHDEVDIEMLLEASDTDKMPHIPPNHKSQLFVTLEGFHKEDFGEKVFGPVTLPFNLDSLGWGLSDRVELPAVPQSLGSVVRTLKEGEEAWVTLKAGSAFKADTEVDGVTIQAGEPVKYSVKIEEHDWMCNPFPIHVPENLDYARKLYWKGVDYYKRDCLEAAAAKFMRMKKYLKFGNTDSKYATPDFLYQVRTLLTLSRFGLAELYGNHAQLEIFSEMKHAMKNCDKALALEKFGVSKALIAQVYYQRGLLYMEKKEFEEAGKDFSSVIKLVEEISGRDREETEGDKYFAAEVLKGKCDAAGMGGEGDMSVEVEELILIPPGLLESAKLKLKEAGEKEKEQNKATWVRWYPSSK